MIFGYTIAEAKKFVITVITFVAAIVGMFLAYNPGVTESAITLAGGVIALVGVFLEPQFSVEDFSKGVRAIEGAAIGLANYWFTINPSLEMKIYSGVGSGIVLFIIIWANNEKSHNEVTIAKTVKSTEVSVHTTPEQLPKV